MTEKNMVDSNQEDLTESASNNGTITPTITINTKRIKDLENLIEKKFSNKQDRKKSTDDECAGGSGGGGVGGDDDGEDGESKISTDSSQNYFNFNDSDDKLEDCDDYEFNNNSNNNNNNNNDIDDENQSKFNSIKQNIKHDETELKALNEFIRLNTNFKFERLENDKKIDNDGNQEMDYDHDYNQSELENEENIRNIIQLCKNKYPELKYKITKSVKTVFKEKFRIAFKKIEDKVKLKHNELNDSSVKFSHNNNNNKVFNTTKSNQTLNNNNNNNSTVNSSLFKPQEFKNKTNEINTNKQPVNSMITNTPSQSLKHSSNSSNDSLKSSKKLKSTDESFNKSLTKTPPSITTPFDNKFLFNPTNIPTSSPSPLIPTPNPLDAEFMRLAAAAFRFPQQNLDFNALNNPYLNLNNFFRNNLSNSPFGLNPPTHPFTSNLVSPSPTSSSSPQPLSMPVSSLASSSPSSQSSGSNSYSNSKNNIISPTSKNNGTFFNPNHHLPSGHNYQTTENSNDNKFTSHNNYKHNNSNNNNKSCYSSINGESKYTNGNSNGTTSTNNPINNIMSSYKLKLGNKASKLTSAEIQTTKTLINCYKESAAYLNRTVEELEQLLNESIENDSK